MSDTRLDAARQAALAEAEKNERRARGFTIAAGLFEAIVFVAIVLVIDFGNPTHLVVFLCACLVYGPLAFGLFALRSHIDVSTRRVLMGLQFGSED